MTRYREIKLGRYLSAQVDNSGNVGAFSDERPYRFGISTAEIDASLFTFPFSRLDKDIALKTIFGASIGEAKLTAQQLGLLEKRVDETDLFYAAINPACQLLPLFNEGARSSDMQELSVMVEDAYERFRRFLNKPLE